MVAERCCRGCRGGEGGRRERRTPPPSGGVLWSRFAQREPSGAAGSSLAAGAAAGAGADVRPAPARLVLVGLLPGGAGLNFHLRKSFTRTRPGRLAGTKRAGGLVVAVGCILKFLKQLFQKRRYFKVSVIVIVDI